MKGKLIISEEEKMNILKKYSINEALAGGPRTNEVPNKVEFTYRDVKSLDGGDLFPTGSYKVDTNSASFKKAVEDLSKLPLGTKVEVQGGASAVGSDRGFDNKTLAFNRAKAFVEALTNAGVDKIYIDILGGKVGEATKYNSPEAKKEQFVKYAVSPQIVLDMDVQFARDNTAVNKPAFPPFEENKPKKKSSGNFVIVYEIEYSPDKGQYFKTIDSSVRNGLEGKILSIKNVTKKLHP